MPFATDSNPLSDNQPANPQNMDTGTRPLSTTAIASAGQNQPDIAGSANIGNQNQPDMAGSANSDNQGGREPLFPDNELQSFRSQWNEAQALFVDDPRRAVQQADSLVANTVQRIAQQFSDERMRLEQQWDRGGDVSTEDLRVAIRRYREFFDRLLSL